MTFALSRLEELAYWCDTSAELEDARRVAQSVFFGDDDPAPVKYWPGLGDHVTKRRRFLGWFMFSHTLPNGQKPAEIAAQMLLAGVGREEALKAIREARYVLSVITGRIPGQSLFLQLEDENFEVRSKALARLFGPPQSILLHIVPSQPGVFIPGPGWLEWPVRIGPNMRRELKRYQLAPIDVERFLQSRLEEPGPEDRVAHPHDATLEEAVARMTEAARVAGKSELAMPPEEWKRLVLRHLKDVDINAFVQEVIQRIGTVEDTKELNHWLPLAMNIWNTTPQPNRGGKTADELSGRKIKPFEGD